MLAGPTSACETHRLTSGTPRRRGRGSRRRTFGPTRLARSPQSPSSGRVPAVGSGSSGRRTRSSRVFDIPTAGPLLSIVMSAIAQAIANRQSEIDRLQAEIKALTDVEQILPKLREGCVEGSRSTSRQPPTRSPARRARKHAAAATAGGGRRLGPWGSSGCSTCRPFSARRRRAPPTARRVGGCLRGGLTGRPGQVRRHAGLRPDAGPFRSLARDGPHTSTDT